MIAAAISLSDGAAATLVAAGIAGVIALIGLVVNGVRAERARRRTAFAEAFSCIVAYQEFPYVVRRRRDCPDGEERVRISEELRKVQQELGFHQAWIELEATASTVDAYLELVSATRRVAGGYMRDAWEQPPTTSDAQMNIKDIDYEELKPLEAAFLARVAHELSWRRGNSSGQASQPLVLGIAAGVFVLALAAGLLA